MTLRAGRRGVLVAVEALPADELPRGVPQASSHAESTSERTEGGRFAPGARTAQSAGGRARAGKTRLAARLRLSDAFADPRFEPYARAAKDFQRAHTTTLARTVGGGRCGPAPSSIIASAALQLAASRFAFEVLGEMALGSRLADASRQNLLAAHELAAREAAARPRDEQPEWRRLMEAHREGVADQKKVASGPVSGVGDFHDDKGAAS